VSIGTVGSVEVCKGRYGVVSYVMVVYGQQWLDKADKVRYDKFGYVRLWSVKADEVIYGEFHCVMASSAMLS